MANSVKRVYVRKKDKFDFKSKEIKIDMIFK